LNCPSPLAVFSHRAGIGAEDRWAGLSNKTLNQLIQELTQGCYLIKGKGCLRKSLSPVEVNLKEVNFKTMQSRLCQGLFFAEILDIDGVTGVLIFRVLGRPRLAGQAMGRKRAGKVGSWGRWGRMKRISLLASVRFNYLKL